MTIPIFKVHQSQKLSICMRFQQPSNAVSYDGLAQKYVCLDWEDPGTASAGALKDAFRSNRVCVANCALKADFGKTFATLFLKLQMSFIPVNEQLLSGNEKYDRMHPHFIGRSLHQTV
jgi:hypothetical protein